MNTLLTHLCQWHSKALRPGIEGQRDMPPISPVSAVKPNGICAAPLYQGVRNAFDLPVTY
jgi:hypothetical protein